MDIDFLKDFVVKLNFFDITFFLIMTYFLIQCSSKGFTLSFISFMKWVLALIVTIFFTPKLQPWVSEYIESPFLNDFGLGIVIYIISLFIIIMIGKALGSSIKWTGFGQMDKAFGLLFGVFKGYVVSVCLFSLTNWFYPLDNWNINVEKSFSYSIVKRGSEVLIEEFPKQREFENTKEKIEKI